MLSQGLSCAQIIDCEEVLGRNLKDLCESSEKFSTNIVQVQYLPVHNRVVEWGVDRDRGGRTWLLEGG